MRRIYFRKVTQCIWELAGKGRRDKKDVQQPYSDKLAPKRAFSLKQSYMRTVLKYIEEQGEKAVSNYEISLNYEPLVSEEELQQNTFEDIIMKNIAHI